MKNTKITQKFLVGTIYSNIPSNALNLIYFLLSYFYTVRQLLPNLTCRHHYYHISCLPNKVLSFSEISK
jgi:hypothetical protein